MSTENDIRDYPAPFRKFGVLPSADKNMAGYKDPEMNAKPAPPPVVKKAAKVRKPAPAKVRKPAAPPDRTELDSIKSQAKIAGGIEFGNKPPWAQQDTVETDFDPFTVDPDDVPDAVVEARAAQPQSQPQRAAARPSYLNQSVRLTMELPDGQFAMSVIDVRKSKYSVLVLVPLKADSGMFIPKLGTKLSLTYKGESVKVLYPGAYVEIEELGVGFLTFIMDES